MCKQTRQVMEHAGVAITITTFTDLVAFAIASFATKITFVRLFLSSQQDEKIALISYLSTFCYYAILGLAFVYLYMCTFFLAILTFDQKRLEAGRWFDTWD